MIGARMSSSITSADPNKASDVGLLRDQDVGVHLDTEIRKAYRRQAAAPNEPRLPTQFAVDGERTFAGSLGDQPGSAPDAINAEVNVLDHATEGELLLRPHVLGQDVRNLRRRWRVGARSLPFVGIAVTQGIVCRRRRRNLPRLDACRFAAASMRVAPRRRRTGNICRRLGDRLAGPPRAGSGARSQKPL